MLYLSQSKSKGMKAVGVICFDLLKTMLLAICQYVHSHLGKDVLFQIDNALSPYV